MKKPDPELPTFIRNWNQFYIIVGVWLVLLVFIFWLITLYFR
ncbi:hypothetical protein [Mucilaginibacter yixingensis]|nr:hypothetical protein [Mucilaginibacter yixingensis]